MLKDDDNFDTVVSLLVVHDSDDSAKQTAESVNYSLRITGLIDDTIAPFGFSDFNGKKIGFVLFPGYDEKYQLCETGRLEDLCLKMFKKQQVLVQVDNYLTDYTKKGNTFKRFHKNRLHATFSFTDDYVSNKLGETAKAHGFDYESPYFTPFLGILQQIEGLQNDK
jgi:hypothetical protein